MSNINKKMYINGEWVSAIGGEYIEDVCPIDGTVIGRVPASDYRDLDIAVRAAASAFTEWSVINPHERAEYIRRAANAIKARMLAFEEIIVKELGMPVTYCRSYQIESSINEAEYYADLCEKYQYHTLVDGGEIVREAVGVAAFITPWNYPLDQITLKVFPALAAGNCVIVKPSKSAPMTALLLAEAMEEAGFPAGTFNVLTGVGSDLGEAIVKHPDIDIVSFTGSTEVGKRIGGQAVSSTAKKIILEMGGKSAMIVLDDADIDAAVSEVLDSTFINSGQTCCAYTRLIVPESKLEQVEDCIIRTAGKYTVGDPWDKEVHIGPVISQRAVEKTHKYVKTAVQQGAKILYRYESDMPASGFFTAPIVLTDVRPDMEVAQEEIFGPVLCIITAKDTEEAIDIANGTCFGLDGSVYGNPEDAMKTAGRIKSGNVHINGAGYTPQLPFGGYKESGIGREGGVYGFEEYLEIKVLFY